MENKDNHQPDKLANLRWAARMSSVVLMIVYAMIVLMIGFFTAAPSSPRDYITLLPALIYIIGLIIAFRWGLLVANYHMCLNGV